MEPGDRKIQDRLQGFLRKIRTEEIRNKVSVWQKYLANASSRFRLNSFSSVDECSTGSSSKQNQDDTEDDISIASENVCTPSDSGTCIHVIGSTSAMEEPLTNGQSTQVKLLNTPDEIVPRNKSPVQQWVDSLPSEENLIKVEDIPPPQPTETADAEVEGFTLGAEAVGVTSPRPYPYVQVTNTCGGSDAGSHCSSMESLLESRRPDPEEVLFELGFGGTEEPDTVSRIPARFLQPSTLKGVQIEEFLKHEQLLGHTYTSGSSGYRGISGPFHTIPSGIVGKIMERLREAEVGRNNNRPHFPSLHHNNRLNLKDSVLSPDNRKWLQRQGVSPEPEGRRIILGQKSFVLAKDGGIVEGSFKRDTSFRVEDLEKTENSKEGLNDSRKSDSSELGMNSSDKHSDDGMSSDYDDDDVSKSHFSSRMASLDNEQLELEYKTIALLAKQLKDSDMSVDIMNEEDFYKLTNEERKRIERALIENALYTFQRRLRDLDLRCHLKEILTSQVNIISNILGRPDHEWINTARQMTNLLRHQETLREELRLTKESYEKS